MSHTATLEPSPELHDAPAPAAPPYVVGPRRPPREYRINSSNAAAYARLGNIAIRKKKELANIALAASLIPPASPPDPFVTELAQAQAELLRKLRNSKDSRDQAYLAKALRDLRETYHMATGTPKPGMIKPGSARPMPRQLVAPIPTVTPVTPVTAQSAEAMPTMPAATPAESS